MPIGRRNAVLAQQAAQQLADSIAPPAEEFKTPAKKAAAKKKTAKKKTAKKKALKKDQ